MLARVVLADLWRNPRRSLAATAGVTVGVGLFCGVLFFVDGLSSSMTQRAVEPLAIDMQRIVTEGAGSTLELTQVLDPIGPVDAGDEVGITLEIDNPGEVAAHEVTLRSRPAAGLDYVPGSAEIDGRPIGGGAANPLAAGPGTAGRNLGTIAPGHTRRVTYRVVAAAPTAVDDEQVTSTWSSRESATPLAANQDATPRLDELAARIARVPGVAAAMPLSRADLGPGTLQAGTRTVAGPARIFGFDSAYADRDPTITITDGRLDDGGAALSAEAASALGVGLGDVVTVTLPDGGSLEATVTAITDLTRSRSLFSSRRGGDLETFVYTPDSVVVSSETFAERVVPAFERAASAGSGRLKAPPTREVDVTLDRDALDADPATALTQSERVASAVMASAPGQDYLLDNVSNTLTVAVDDAATARRLFAFLGIPGALLAAVLAAYAGNVLAEAQRRDQAVLRTRGASRRHLLRMLAVRTTALVGVGALAGLVAGYVAATVVLGHASLARASTSALVSSAVVGTAGGLLVTGAALYLTGRRAIDREIDEDRRRLDRRAPLWRRARLDLVLAFLLAVAVTAALGTGAFEGSAGSVYSGRAVRLDLALLVLPVSVWLAGSLVAARLMGAALARATPTSAPRIDRPGPALLRRSVTRRPWAVVNAALVASLVVALAACLATFTASYDAAKVDDARYSNGADVRVTPSPTAERDYGAGDADRFRVAGVAEVTPVVYSASNVVLRSDRTSDPANLAAVEPTGFPAVAPVDAGTAALVDELERDPTGLILSRDTAGFLQVGVGDRVHVLLARSTPDQVEIVAHVSGLFERLPGFPDGADAVMALDRHLEAVPATVPDFFLASVERGGDAALQEAVTRLRRGPASSDTLSIDTRATTFDRDQSSLAALNVAGLVDLDGAFALAMATVAVGVFVFGLLLQRRREYVVLRAQGVGRGTLRLLIAAEAAIVAVGGAIVGLVVGVTMGALFVAVLRPLFVLDPGLVVPWEALGGPVALLAVATVVASLGAASVVGRLAPTELLRDE